jgi:hypothetical protein
LPDRVLGATLSFILLNQSRGGVWGQLEHCQHPDQCRRSASDATESGVYENSIHFTSSQDKDRRRDVAGGWTASADTDQHRDRDGGLFFLPPGRCNVDIRPGLTPTLFLEECVVMSW